MQIMVGYGAWRRAIGRRLGTAIFLTVGLAHCQGERLRGPAPDTTAVPVAALSTVAPKALKTGLAVTVVPATGMSVLLDGKRVADTSPYLNESVAPGPHVLHVRAMGYHSVTLAVAVRPNEVLQVPVALRARPTSAAQPGATARAPQPAPERAQAAPSQAALAPVRGPTTPLPVGARPLLIEVQLDPPGPLWVDGELVAGEQAELAHGTGRLQAGALALTYRVYPGRVMELTVPHDKAAWFRDGSQVKATSQLRIEGRPVRLRRILGGSSPQEVLVRRLE